ncbi:hypothetical protein CK203_024167 [Vitis vinifera]|uniref:Uncharacterized protein n=1 Tax=Vitis vinifera TaxID=29760 RepID=A0A438I4I6_VITVI|nr:hypothetical protein CK203_024167 [Vitis vinifera]
MKRNLIPSEKKTNPKLIISTAKPTQLPQQREKPVNHKDSKAEAGNAEDGNPSCGDAIGSLVPSAPRHQPHFFTNEASASSLSHSQAYLKRGDMENYGPWEGNLVKAQKPVLLCGSIQISKWGRRSQSGIRIGLMVKTAGRGTWSLGFAEQFCTEVVHASKHSSRSNRSASKLGWPMARPSDKEPRPASASGGVDARLSALRHVQGIDPHSQIYNQSISKSASTLVFSLVLNLWPSLCFPFYALHNLRCTRHFIFHSPIDFTTGRPEWYIDEDWNNKKDMKKETEKKIALSARSLQFLGFLSMLLLSTCRLIQIWVQNGKYSLGGVGVQTTLPCLPRGSSMRLCKDINWVSQSLMSQAVDVNYIGTVSLRVKCQEFLLREEEADEVEIQYRDFVTDVTPLFAAAHFWPCFHCQKATGKVSFWFLLLFLLLA